MKPGIPWSVKGIDGRAREVAKDAARAEGLTLGEWLNQKILESAQEDAELTARATRKKSASSVSRHTSREPRREPASNATPASKDEGENAVARKLDELFERIASLQAPAQAAPAPASIRTEPLDSGASFHAMQHLLDRIESGEKRTHASLDLLGDRVERLGSRVEEIAERPADIRAKDIPGFSALEGAVRNIVDHIAKSEAQSRETVSSLQGRLSELSGKIENPAKPGGVSPEVISTLERRMAELAAQVEGVAGSVGDEKLKQVFEARIRELAERIDTVRHSAETMGQKAEATANEAARRQAEAIEKRLAALVAEAEEKLSGSGDGDSRLAEIHAEIGKLNNRFEQIRQEAATEHEVQALRSALEKLSSRVEEAPGLEPIAQIEQRIAELSEQLEAVSYPAAELQPQIGQLEQRIEALDTQIATSAAVAQPDPALAEQIAQIEHRLAATEQQLGSLGTIENSIQQLFTGLEQSRVETRELISGMGSGAPEAGAETSPSELKALQDGLAAVRANAEAADQRTQETLEAVHETLAQIIEKLGELDRDGGASTADAASGIEEIAANAAAAAAAMAAASGPESGSALAGQASPAGGSAPEHQPAAFSPFEDPATAAPAMSAAPAWTAKPQSAPAQAGTGNDDWLSVVRAHMTQHHGGASTQAMPAAPAAGAGHVDFIAAARRAAAAATPHSPAGATLTAGAGFGDVPMPNADDMQQSRLASLLSRKGQKQPGSAGSGKAEDKASSRKRLVLAALVLLTAVSAYAVNSGMLLKKPTKHSSLSQPAVTQQIDPVKQAAAEPASTIANKIDLPANAAPVALPQPAPAVASAQMDAASSADPMTTASIAPAQSDPMLSQQPSPLGQAFSTTGPAPAQTAQLPEQIGTAELRQAALGGDARAQFIVASRYLEGRVIGRDHAAAAYWYTQAANGGLSAKDQVKLAQQLLAQKGFDPGTADGEMGTRTANAIRLYQLRNGLPVNGSVSKQLLEHLQQGTI